MQNCLEAKGPDVCNVLGNEAGNQEGRWTDREAGKWT